ncbi:hypothetical protein HMPREF9946_03326 [Acetobacteraceae bacterium AT-5844]|nr:hypothetical protein HMPREF9946_03326 [Acetobacteraceae bacterium AT-5844]
MGIALVAAVAIVAVTAPGCPGVIGALWSRAAGAIVAVGAVMAALGGRVALRPPARYRQQPGPRHEGGDQLQGARDEVDRAVAREPDAAQRLRDQWSRD